MAGTTGLEPATSDVTGRRSNQLNYVPAKRVTPERLQNNTALLDQASHTTWPLEGVRPRNASGHAGVRYRAGLPKIMM